LRLSTEEVLRDDRNPSGVVPWFNETPPVTPPSIMVRIPVNALMNRLAFAVVQCIVGHHVDADHRWGLVERQGKQRRTDSGRLEELFGNDANPGLMDFRITRTSSFTVNGITQISASFIYSTTIVSPRRCKRYRSGVLLTRAAGTGSGVRRVQPGCCGNPCLVPQGNFFGNGSNEYGLVGARQLQISGKFFF